MTMIRVSVWPIQVMLRPTLMTFNGFTAIPPSSKFLYKPQYVWLRCSYIFTISHIQASCKPSSLSRGLQHARVMYEPLLALCQLGSSIPRHGATLVPRDLFHTPCSLTRQGTLRWSCSASLKIYRKSMKKATNRIEKQLTSVSTFLFFAWFYTIHTYM